MSLKSYYIGGVVLAISVYCFIQWMPFFLGGVPK